MASGWIVRITNNSNYEFIFRQTDNNMHPVIGSSNGVDIIEQGVQNPQNVQVQSGQQIRVRPGGRLTASWFAIPWQGWGNLAISHNNNIVNTTTGPHEGKDYLIFDGVADKALFIGQQHGWQNVEFEVEIDNKGGMVFKPVGGNDFDWLRKQLVDFAVMLFKALITGQAPGQQQAQGKARHEQPANV
ncbi:MAG: hypothetical protein ACRERR_09840 [Moraxellaceae bacterium]